MSTITKGQIRAVRAIAAQRFDGDGEYYSFLQETFHKASTLDLTFQEAQEFIRLMGDGRHEKKIHTSKQRKYFGAGAKDGFNAVHLTQHQADEISRLEAELGWTANPKRLLGYIQRIIHKSCAPSMLMKYEAAQLILGMRRVLLFERKKNGAQTADAVQNGNGGFENENVD